ncbi:MAG: N-acetylmuramoyl-L-alanine amidase [Fimbriimonas sp.]
MLVTFAALLALSFSPMICIDPGHPSEVGRGTQGRRITEIGAAWQVGVALKAKLMQRGYRVVLTKKSIGELVRNKERALIANRNHASLAVRLHCDAASGSGFTVYFPTKQGRAEGARGPSAEVLSRSAQAAKSFHTAMAQALKGQLRDNGLKSDTKTHVGSKQGALTGSIFSKVPVLLVEMAVLTNRKDEAFIASTKGKAVMVEALAKGVDAALNIGQPPQR